MMVNTEQARRRARLKREALALAGRAGYALAMGVTALMLSGFLSSSFFNWERNHGNY
jgi:hypothetical protein